MGARHQAQWHKLKIVNQQAKKTRNDWHPMWPFREQPLWCLQAPQGRVGRQLAPSRVELPRTCRLPADYASLTWSAPWTV